MLLVGQQEGHSACKKVDVGLTVVTIVEVYNCFSALSEEEQDQRPTFWDEVNNDAKTILGLLRPSKNDWLTSEALDITEQKRAAEQSSLAICRSTRHFLPNLRTMTTRHHHQLVKDQDSDNA